MSAIKNYIEDEIEKLAKMTGYTWDFLMDIWNEVLDDGSADWDYFVGVTLERDW